MFDPFTSIRPEWVFSAQQPVLGNDVLLADARMAQFRADLPGAPARDTFEVVMRIKAGRAGQRQIALYAIRQPGLYYCDLDNTGTVGYWGIERTPDGIMYSSLDEVPAVAPLENGDVRITMLHEPPTVSCVTDWPTDRALLSAAIPIGIAPNTVSVSVIGLDIELMSFIHIHSD